MSTLKCCIIRSLLSFDYRQVNHQLRWLAEKDGTDEERLNKLANSVQDFTYHLLDPLRSKSELFGPFETCLDEILDEAIEMEQKKVVSLMPVVSNNNSN